MTVSNIWIWSFQLNCHQLFYSLYYIVIMYNYIYICIYLIFIFFVNFLFIQKRAVASFDWLRIFHYWKWRETHSNLNFPMIKMKIFVNNLQKISWRCPSRVVSDWYNYFCWFWCTSVNMVGIHLCHSYWTLNCRKLLFFIMW